MFPFFLPPSLSSGCPPYSPPLTHPIRLSLPPEPSGCFLLSHLLVHPHQPSSFPHHLPLPTHPAVLLARYSRSRVRSLRASTCEHSARQVISPPSYHAFRVRCAVLTQANPLPAGSKESGGEKEIYDEIVEEYSAIKSNPYKTFVEEPTFFAMLGDMRAVRICAGSSALPASRQATFQARVCSTSRAGVDTSPDRSGHWQLGSRVQVLGPDPNVVLLATDVVCGEGQRGRDREKQGQRQTDTERQTEIDRQTDRTTGGTQRNRGTQQDCKDTATETQTRRRAETGTD
eukprot:608391-Rhodomonas_salina.1